MAKDGHRAGFFPARQAALFSPEVALPGGGWGKISATVLTEFDRFRRVLFRMLADVRLSVRVGWLGRRYNY